MWYAPNKTALAFAIKLKAGIKTSSFFKLAAINDVGLIPNLPTVNFDLVIFVIFSNIFT